MTPLQMMSFKMSEDIVSHADAATDLDFDVYLWTANYLEKMQAEHGIGVTIQLLAEGALVQAGVLGTLKGNVHEMYGGDGMIEVSPRLS